MIFKNSYEKISRHQFYKLYLREYSEYSKKDIITFFYEDLIKDFTYSEIHLCNTFSTPWMNRIMQSSELQSYYVIVKNLKLIKELLSEILSIAEYNKKHIFSFFVLTNEEISQLLIDIPKNTYGWKKYHDNVYINTFTNGPITYLSFASENLTENSKVFDFPESFCHVLFFITQKTFQEHAFRKYYKNQKYSSSIDADIREITVYISRILNKKESYSKVVFVNTFLDIPYNWKISREIGNTYPNFYFFEHEYEMIFPKEHRAVFRFEKFGNDWSFSGKYPPYLAYIIGSDEEYLHLRVLPDISRYINLQTYSYHIFLYFSRNSFPEINEILQELDSSFQIETLKKNEKIRVNKNLFHLETLYYGKITDVET